MGLFSFTQELAMDLGTANSIIVNNVGKILLDEPSIVALDRKTDKMIALGEKARQMHGKTHENIRTVRPLRDGVIADFNAAEQMIRGMIKMANKNRGNGLFSPSYLISSSSFFFKASLTLEKANIDDWLILRALLRPDATALIISIESKLKY